MSRPEEFDVFSSAEVCAFDDISIDPLIRNILSRISEMNKEGIDAGDINHKVNALDEEWRSMGLMNKECLVSGIRGWTYKEDGTQHIKKAVSSQLKSTSIGFGPSLPESQQVQMSASDKMQLGLWFKSGYADIASPFYVRIEDLIEIDFGKIMSVPKAEAILRYYAADILAEIDNIIDKSRNAEEMFVLFGELIFELEYRECEHETLLRAINVYIAGKVPIDDEAHYLLSAHDTEMYCFDKNEKLVVVEAEAFTNEYGRVDSIIFLTPTHDEGATSVIAHVKFVPIEKSMKHERQILFIPCFALTSSISMRNLVWRSDAIKQQCAVIEGRNHAK